MKAHILSSVPLDFLSFALVTICQNELAIAQGQRDKIVKLSVL